MLGRKLWDASGLVRSLWGLASVDGAWLNITGWGISPCSLLNNLSLFTVSFFKASIEFLVMTLPGSRPPKSKLIFKRDGSFSEKGENGCKLREHFGCRAL